MGIALFANALWLSSWFYPGAQAAPTWAFGLVPAAGLVALAVRRQAGTIWWVNLSGRLAQ